MFLILTLLYKQIKKGFSKSLNSKSFYYLLHTHLGLQSPASENYSNVYNETENIFGLRGK